MAWYTVTTGSILCLWRQSLTPGCTVQWEVEACPDWWPSLLTAQAFQRINTSKTKLICLQPLHCLSHPWAECSLSCFSCRSLISGFIKGRSWRIRLVKNELSLKEFSELADMQRTLWAGEKALCPLISLYSCSLLSASLPLFGTSCVSQGTSQW